MKHWIPFVLGLSLLVLCKEASLACSCGRTSVEDAYLQSDAVFLGEVIDVRKNVGSIGRWFYEVQYRFKGGPFDDSVYYMSVTFSVKKEWKGSSGASVVVQTADAKVCCICGYDFQLRHTYLVYAYGSPLHTSICSRTKPISEAVSETAVLDRLKVPTIPSKK